MIFFLIVSEHTLFHGFYLLITILRNIFSDIGLTYN